MTDREKIIKALECCDDSCGGENLRCEDCPYKDVDAGTCETIHALHADVRKLLKEQEPVKPVKKQIFSSIFGWVCGACGRPFLSDYYKYCPWCGRAVKWNAD